MAPSQDFKVAIIGGGICGVALAASLTRSGVRVTLFESARQFEEVGAGIGLGHNALKALGELGILDIVSRSGEPAQRTFRFVSESGDHHMIHDYPPDEASDGLGIHRATLLNAMVSLLNPTTIHFNKRCVRVSPSPSSHMSCIHFSDGTIQEADIVIGADGIKSVVRDAVVQDGAKHMVYTNTSAARGLIPTQKLKEAGVKIDISKRPVCFVGRSRHIIAFPINLGQTINIVAFRSDNDVPMGSTSVQPPWVRPIAREALLEAFEGSGPDVTKVLECLENPKEWYIHGLYPQLPTFIHGTIVLIGDAAHGMLPHLGAGAGQGIEDVFILTRLLCHPDAKASNLVDIAEAYNSVRVSRANEVSDRSLAAGKAFDSLGKLSEAEIESRIRNQWDYVWHHDIRADLEVALDSLRKKGKFT